MDLVNQYGDMVQTLLELSHSYVPDDTAKSNSVHVGIEYSYGKMHTMRPAFNGIFSVSSRFFFI
jgi:hypothetical protein